MASYFCEVKKRPKSVNSMVWPRGPFSGESLPKSPSSFGFCEMSARGERLTTAESQDLLILVLV